MPSLRGIDMSLVTYVDSKLMALPEFFHFDSDLGPNPILMRDDSQATITGSLAKDKQEKRIYAVYVPSAPNTKFFFKYSVEIPPSGTPENPDVKYMFFKVLINGRSVVSWGINLRKVTGGVTYRALYGPSPYQQANHAKEHGTGSQPGIEARYFWFLPDKRNTSVANEGGVVEVQVFRAMSRVGRAPTLDPYHNHDKYGIGILSDGFIDKPEEATYYDYRLMDPKDLPYATFQFHYRSWHNLTHLHLITVDDPSLPASQSQSSIATAGQTKTASKQSVRRHRKTLSADADGWLTKTRGFNQGHDDLGGYESDDERDHTPSKVGRHEAASRHKSGTAMLSMMAPPLPCPLANAADRFPQPSKASRDRVKDLFVNRPLPERPLPDIPGDVADMRSHSAMSGRSSAAASDAPSITPSLLPYVDDDAFGPENVEYGVAKGVDVYKCDFSRSAEQSLVAERLTQAQGGAHDDVPWYDQMDGSCSGNTPSRLPKEGRGVYPRPIRHRRESTNQPEDTSVSNYALSVASTDENNAPPTNISPGQYIAAAAAASETDLERQASIDASEAETPSPPQRRRNPGRLSGLFTRPKVSPKARRILGEEVDLDDSFVNTPSPNEETAAEHGWADQRPIPRNMTFFNQPFDLSEGEWMRGNRKHSSQVPQSDLPGADSGGNSGGNSGGFLRRLWNPRPKKSGSSGKKKLFGGSMRVTKETEAETEAEATTPTTPKEIPLTRMGPSIYSGYNGEED